MAISGTIRLPIYSVDWDQVSFMSALSSSSSSFGKKKKDSGIKKYHGMYGNSSYLRVQIPWLQIYDVRTNSRGACRLYISCSVPDELTGEARAEAEDALAVIENATQIMSEIVSDQGYGPLDGGIWRFVDTTFGDGDPKPVLQVSFDTKFSRADNKPTQAMNLMYERVREGTTNDVEPFQGPGDLSVAELQRLFPVGSYVAGEFALRMFQIADPDAPGKIRNYMTLTMTKCRVTTRPDMSKRMLGTRPKRAMPGVRTTDVPAEAVEQAARSRKRAAVQPEETIPANQSGLSDIYSRVRAVSIPSAGRRTFATRNQQYDDTEIDEMAMDSAA